MSVCAVTLREGIVNLFAGHPLFGNSVAMAKSCRRTFAEARCVRGAECAVAGGWLLKGVVPTVTCSHAST